MPAITTCNICGFRGNHGFSSKAAGIMHFYHGNGSDFCGFFNYQGKSYKTLESAWKVARKSYPDDNWRKGYDAIILENNEKKGDKLLESWRKKRMVA